MDPLICAILKPVWHASVGNEYDAHGIFDVCVNVPQIAFASNLRIGITLPCMFFPLKCHAVCERFSYFPVTLQLIDKIDKRAAGVN